MNRCFADKVLLSRHDAPRHAPGAGECAMRQGFTLLEMLIAVVVLAVLSSTMAVAIAGRQDRYALRAAAKDLAAALQFASAQSRAKHCNHWVVLTNDLSGYRVEEAAVGSSQRIGMSGPAGRMKRLPEEVRIVSVRPSRGSSDMRNLLLAGDGREEAFSGTVTLRNRAGRTATIVVAPVTGQVYVAQ